MPLWHVNPHFIIMGLFNFSAPSNSSEGQDVQILINDESITVPAAEAKGMTVAQLFTRFASGVCDVTRINRYVAQGRIVSGTSNVEEGTIYSGAIASEAKG